MLHGLDLFSGIGGLSIALAPWARPVAYCDNDRYACAVLLSRISSGELPAAPVWSDVQTLGAAQIGAVPIDIIYGGFPCQDISVAGNGAGLEGKRSGLFFEILRLVDELKPSFVFLENVPAIRTRGAERVVKELASRGYDCRWDVLSANDVGAPHLRKRWFLLAYRHGDGQQIEPKRDGVSVTGEEGQLGDYAHGLRDAISDPQRDLVRDEQGRGRGTSGDGPAVPFNDGGEESVAHSLGVGCGQGDQDTGGLRSRASAKEERPGPTDYGWWASEPNVGRVAHGVSARVDRLRGLGNAVVPAQAREAFQRLMGIK